MPEPGPAGEGRLPLLPVLIVLGLLGAALLVFQPYTADWPGRAYSRPARAYIRAAIREDSAGLARISASPAPVAWGLEVARRRRETLELWSRRIEAWIGERSGDTAIVYVYPPGERCGESPIVLRFVGSGRKARVLEAGSTCMER